MAVALLIAGAFLVLHTLYQPFAEAGHNRLETAALLALTLTYYIGVLVKAAQGGGVDDAQSQAFGVALILLTCSVGVACVVILYLSWRESRHAVHEAKHGHGDHGGKHSDHREPGNDLEQSLLERSAGDENASSI